MNTRALAATALAIVAYLGPVNATGLDLGLQDSKAQTTPASSVNLNAATVADLEKLPGVGPAMAAKIIEYRQKAGGFKKIEELMNVQGIGEKNFLKLKPLVTVVASKAAEK